MWVFTYLALATGLITTIEFEDRNECLAEMWKYTNAVYLDGSYQDGNAYGWDRIYPPGINIAEISCVMH